MKKHLHILGFYALFALFSGINATEEKNERRADIPKGLHLDLSKVMRGGFLGIGEGNYTGLHVMRCCCDSQPRLILESNGQDDSPHEGRSVTLKSAPTTTPPRHTPEV